MDDMTDLITRFGIMTNMKMDEDDYTIVSLALVQALKKVQPIIDKYVPPKSKTKNYRFDDNGKITPI